MTIKFIIFCAQLLLIKMVSSQYIGHGMPSLSAPCAAPIAPVPSEPSPAPSPPTNSCRGPLIVTSSSPINPTGLSIAADNLVIDGALQVNGSFPLLGTVVIDGAVPVDGLSSVTYGCRSNNVGIFKEGLPHGHGRL